MAVPHEPSVPMSIIIPSFNRPGLLQSSAASALAALPEGSEIIVTDDRSDPSAEESLRNLTGAALRVVKNSKKRGAASNRNFGVSACRGEIILFLDDDDLLRPGYPDAILNRFAASKDHSWGFSTTLSHRDPTQHIEGFDGVLVLADAEKLSHRKRMGGLGCGFWIRRELFSKIGGLDNDLSVNEDTELCVRLYSNGHVPAISTQPGVSILTHDGPRLSDARSSKERARCFRTIIEKHNDFLNQEPDLKRHLVKRYLKMLAKGKIGRAEFNSVLDAGEKGRCASNVAYFLACAGVEKLRNIRRSPPRVG